MPLPAALATPAGDKRNVCVPGSVTNPEVILFYPKEPLFSLPSPPDPSLCLHIV